MMLYLASSWGLKRARCARLQSMYVQTTTEGLPLPSAIRQAAALMQHSVQVLTCPDWHDYTHVAAAISYSDRVMWH